MAYDDDDDDPRANSPEDLGHKSARRPKRDEAEEAEGPRNFGHFLSQIGDGDFHDECGLKLQELVANLTAFSDRYQANGKGTLTVVLSVIAMGNGQVHVAGDIKTKTPTAKRAGSVFWRTKGNNLAVENPRQQKLNLREVPLPQTKTKDLSNDRPVRGV